MDHDISDKVEMEAVAGKHEQRLRNLMENLPGFVYTLKRSADGHMSLPYAGKGIREIYGINPEEVTEDASPLFEMVHPDDRPMAEAAMTASAEKMTPFFVVLRIIHPAWGERWIETRSIPEKQEDGAVLWHGIILDVSERKKMEEVLRKNRKFLVEAQRISHVGSWELDNKTNILTWSDEIFRIFEIDKGEFGASYEAFLNAIHPDDREMVNRTFTESLKKRIPYEVEHRLQMQDGRVKYVLERGETKYADEGSPLRTLGTVHDITERKLMEASIHALNATLERKVEERTAELRQTLAFNEGIINAIPDPLFEIGKDGTCLNLWNKNDISVAARKCLLPGGNIRETLPPEARDVVLNALAETDRSGSSHGRLYSLELPDGRRWFELSVTKKDPEGTCLALARDVTERETALELIRLLEQALDASEESVWLFAGDGEDDLPLYVNNGACRMLGYSRKELLEQGLFAIDRETNAKEIRNIRNGIETRESLVMERFHTAKDGRNIPVEIRASFFETGGKKYNLAIARDVTERKTAEEAFRKLNATLEKKVLERTAELRQALAFNEGIVNAIPDLLFEVDGQGNYLGFWSGNPAVLEGGKTALPGKNIRDILSPEAAKIALSAIEKAEREGSSSGSVYCTDFPGEGERWYEISVSKKEPKGTFLSLARDVSERKRQQDLLLQREAELRSLAENIPDNIVRFDTAGRYLYINPVHERNMGKTLAEVIGTPIPDTRMEVKAAISRVCESGEVETVRQISEAEGGGVKIHDVTLAPERDAYGKIVSVLGVGRDMTDIVHLHEELAKREEQFRTLAENSPDVIIRYNREGQRVYVNRRAEELFGCSADQIVGKTARESKVLAAETMFMEKFLNVVQTGAALEFESEFTLSTGEKGWGHTRIVPEFDDLGNVSTVLTIGRDISRRKQMEKILAKQEQAFRALAENSPDTIARYDRECRRIYANQAFSRLTGIPVDGLLGQKPSDYNPLPEASAYEMMLKKVFTSGEMGEIEYTWPDAAGNRITSHIRIVPEFDETGEVVSVLATGRDITKLREAHQKIVHLARHDILTGLPNRRTVQEHTDHVIAAARRSGKKAALLFVDLDNFKTVNDSLGHAVGDMLLQEVSRRFLSCIREVDSVGRQGGDEFVITLCGVEQVSDALQVVARLFQELERPICLEGNSLSVSMSVGVALYPDDGDSFDELLKKADAAMYQAKNSGRNACRFASGQHHCAMAEFRHG